MTGQKKPVSFIQNGQKDPGGDIQGASIGSGKRTFVQLMSATAADLISGASASALSSAHDASK